MTPWRIVYQEVIDADTEIVIQARGGVSEDFLEMLELYAKRQRARNAQGAVEGPTDAE